jgi:UDP-N-acetylmuramyl pentapeptide phosphotransferase/UDP-N-acetylglucosamine-1-phosphate transferase
MIAAIILSGIAYVAFQLNDLLNHDFILIDDRRAPWIFGLELSEGLIFLGDGGAYLVGFWVAELSVLLTARHSEVSKRFPFLLCLYPSLKLYSHLSSCDFRRVHPGMPDASHLHQLIYKRIVRWSINSDNAFLKTQRNSLIPLLIYG